VVASLESVDFDEADPLLRDGYVINMVLQHEYQHNETILQALQLSAELPYAAPRQWRVPIARRQRVRGEMVRFAGGKVTIGTDDRSAAYDNERPRHSVALPPFEIDVTPVCNGDYVDFVEDGGYARGEFWSDEGWAWLCASGAMAPQFWEKRGGDWFTRNFDVSVMLDENQPVCHVCFYEAEAYARWSGKRLPSEQEWETAAAWDAEVGQARAYPWGEEAPSHNLANLDQLTFGTAPVWSYSRNVSPMGCYGMIGDVWEWTSSDFHGYTGFQAFPYPEYSEEFFGSEYKVLRGGSWATRPGAIRASFRNWDYPIRRQIFAGFRCARDA
jgi:iron(II)-dependent oxidoreductase